MAVTRSSTRSGVHRPNRRNCATILVAGDWAPIRAFDPVVRANPEAVYGDLLPLLREADLRIVNCECALTSVATPVWKSGAVFKGAPEHVKGLTAVPFEVACLANNHVLDYGVAGLRRHAAPPRRTACKRSGGPDRRQSVCAADRARRAGPCTWSISARAKT